nr:MAG TPA: major outer membrane lipoprotein [Caudoviricetes sp.]
MSNYFDNSHIDGKQLTPQQIADAIRHKKFGVDVREAMAQGLEYCMEQAQKVDKLEQDLSNLNKRLENLPSEVAGIEQDIGTINNEINKLNMAVFGDGAVPIDAQIDSNNQTNKAQEVHLN